MSPLDPETLDALAAAMAVAAHDWWLIGSAAVALHGADAVTIADLDLLVDLRDAEAIAARLGIALAPGNPDSRFRSRAFGRGGGLALPVELMAGLECRVDGRWMPVNPAGRVEIRPGLFIPDRAALVALLSMFDRPKDRARAAALAAA